MNTIRALRIPARGAITLVDLPAGGYQAMARAIDADYIEHVRTPLPGIAMLVDEEGALKARPEVNIAVSGVLYRGRVFGDVLILAEVDGPEGRDVTHLDDTDLARVCERLGIEVPA